LTCPHDKLTNRHDRWRAASGFFAVDAALQQTKVRFPGKYRLTNKYLQAQAAEWRLSNLNMPLTKANPRLGTC
jgi:hypothetical protein